VRVCVCGLFGEEKLGMLLAGLSPVVYRGGVGGGLSEMSCMSMHVYVWKGLGSISSHMRRHPEMEHLSQKNENKKVRVRSQKHE
jgi:hypothetical protein